MKKIFYFLLIILFSISCSVEEESGDQGSSDGSAASPVELTVGTAKSGSVAYNDNSFYKFTTSSTGAGNYKLDVASLAVTDSWSSTRSVMAYIYSNSSYSTSYLLDYDSCLASCTMVFDYDDNLNPDTTYYLKIYGYGDASYSLTVTKGNSEGSKDNPVELTVGTAHTSGTVEGYYYGGQSYYKFTTADADNYTVTMTNSTSLYGMLYSGSDFTSYVDYWSAETSVSETLASGTSGLSANTTYYLEIEPHNGYSIADAATTTYSITIAAEGN
tara:strand:- start:659 stop:1474 length:816 start_codon:yes stop_codon:yes gene_type:complete